MSTSNGNTANANGASSSSKKRIPDARVLFDTFLSRDSDNFQKNPGGSSSLLFHHATLIKLDLEYCEEAGAELALNLTPLYGINEDQQDQVRTKSNGEIKNDVFHSGRAVMYPPAVVSLLVCYNRYHNYIASVLSKINENNRFKASGESAFNDEALYKTTRQIVVRIYRNITIGDWLPSLAAANGLDPSSLSDLSLYKIKDVASRARPSQLYSFEMTLSPADEAWYQEFLAKNVVPGEVKKAPGGDTTEKLSNIKPEDYIRAEKSYEGSIYSPDWRGFNGWRRKMAFLSKTWTYENKNLAETLKIAIEQPAGAFTQHNIPKILRAPTIARIQAARDRDAPKLSKFHTQHGYESIVDFSDLNKTDGAVRIDLAKCYSFAEDIDIFPGLLLEDQQVTIVLGKDKEDNKDITISVTPLFHCLVGLTAKLASTESEDFDQVSLTKWGYNESARDFNIFNGSICYKLIQKGIPNWFPYNSLYVMQPMFNLAHNIAQATADDTIRFYNTSYDHRDIDAAGNKLNYGEPSDPGAKQASPPVFLHGWAKSILSDRESFHVPWAQKFNAMQPGLQTFDNYMLAGDKPTNYEQKHTIDDNMYKKKSSATSDVFLNFVVKTASKLIESHSYESGAGKGIDIVEDVAIPTQTYFLSDLFLLNVKCDWNEKGEYEARELYDLLLKIRIWGFTDFDFTQSWKRRNEAGDAVLALQRSTLTIVQGILDGTIPNPEPNSVREIGTKMVKALQYQKWKDQDIADVLWLTAVGSIGVVAGAFTDSLNLLLAKPDKWQELAAYSHGAENEAKDEPNNLKIRQYFLESIRLSSGQGLLRNVVKDRTVWALAAPPYLPIPIPFRYKAGQTVVLGLGPACNLVPSWAFWWPKSFKPGRNEDDYILWGHNIHQCIGKEFCIVFGTGLFKAVAKLKNVRPMGEGLKKVNLGVPENYFLSVEEDALLFDPVSFKLEYDN